MPSSSKLMQLQHAPTVKPEVAELLHELSQPVTALECALEIGLKKERSRHEYRLLLEEALSEAKRIAGVTRSLYQQIVGS